MAVDPVPSFRDTDDVIVEAINYGTGNAGSFLPSDAGQEYRVWNDKGKVKTSSPMTSVLVTTRDSDGLEVQNLVTQNWIEIKSTTIHAGVAGGSIVGYSHDNMPDFQPVGKNNFVVLGNIPYDCYRKILVRMRIPTSGLKAGVSFKIYVTNQQAQSSIANYITTIHGNGVIYQASGAFAVSINGGDASLLDIEKGFSLITNSRVYYGNSQQYDVSGLANGTYKIYLTQAGAISSILEASAIPANSIELTRAVVAGAICTGVTDKRLFLANVMVGLDVAKTATPTINQVYIATDTEKMYICWVDDAWTQVIPIVDGVTKTGDFTVGKLVKINNASGIVEQGTNTDTEVAAAVTHKDLTDNPHTVTKAQVNLGNVENLKVKLDATSAPGVGNDNTEGYAVGSRWVDATNDKEYVCLDASTGAAVWTETTGAGGGASTFVALTDTPANYTGSSLKHVRVNVGETALEFIELAGGGDMLKTTYDTDDDGIVDKSKTLVFTNALASDHTYSGEVDSQPVGESVVFGDLLYFNWTDKEWKKAKADASATMPGLRIALETKADGETCLMLVKGYIRDDSAFEFAGSIIYVSEATAGAMTSTAPSTAGNQLQRVGQAKSADILFFDPSIDVGEI